MNDKIFVTSPLLPKYEDFTAQVKEIYDSKWLTNMGSKHLELPPKAETSGGVMSIFSLCEASRELNPDACTIIATFPGKFTYAKHSGFSNQENVYRFSQIVENCLNLDKSFISF